MTCMVIEAVIGGSWSLFAKRPTSQVGDDGRGFVVSCVLELSVGMMVV